MSSQTTFVERVTKGDPYTIFGLTLVIVGIILIIVGALKKVPARSAGKEKEHDAAKAKKTHTFIGAAICLVLGIIVLALSSRG